MIGKCLQCGTCCQAIGINISKKEINKRHNEEVKFNFSNDKSDIKFIHDNFLQILPILEKAVNVKG